MAWEREDWAFMLVLPTVRERAPRWRHARVWGEGQCHDYAFVYLKESNHKLRLPTMTTLYCLII